MLVRFDGLLGAQRIALNDARRLHDEARRLHLGGHVGYYLLRVSGELLEETLLQRLWRGIHRSNPELCELAAMDHGD